MSAKTNSRRRSESAPGLLFSMQRVVGPDLPKVRLLLLAHLLELGQLPPIWEG